MPKATQVSLTIDGDRVAVLQKAFPDKKPDDAAIQIATMATNELIDLLAGKKRYLSLSHQYIEWVQQIYEALLPEEEYTFRKIFDGFNFPPGAAGYIARVLRGRQNTSLTTKAKDGLTTKCSKEIETYDKLPQVEKPGSKMRSLRLTSREYDLLQMIIDKLLLAGEPIDPPETTSRTREFVSASWNVENLRRIKPEIPKL